MTDLFFYFPKQNPFLFFIIFLLTLLLTYYSKIFKNSLSKYPHSTCSKKFEPILSKIDKTRGAGGIPSQTIFLFAFLLNRYSISSSSDLLKYSSGNREFSSQRFKFVILKNCFFHIIYLNKTSKIPFSNISKLKR